MAGSCLPPVGISNPISGLPSSVDGGEPVEGTLSFSVENVDSTKITLKSSNPNLAYFDKTNRSASTTVSVSSKSGTSFELQTSPVDQVTHVTISAYDGVVYVGSADLVVNPETLSSLQVSPNIVAGGQLAKGTVCMAYPVKNATTITLDSDPLGIALPDSTVIIQPPGPCAEFTVRTLPQQASSITTISAQDESNNTKLATISVEQPLLSISVNRPSVVGGTVITNGGTVVLSSAAPLGGATVKLDASDSAVSVPSNVTVPPGQSQTTFDISTKSVSSDTTITIKAEYQGMQMTTLTVTAK